MSGVLGRPRTFGPRDRCERALTAPSLRVQPPRSGPLAAPALRPPLQPAAHSRPRGPRRQPDRAQRRDPQPVRHGRAAGWGAVPVAFTVPQRGRCPRRMAPRSLRPSRPQAPQPGLAHGAAPGRAQALPAARPRAAGGNAAVPVTHRRGWSASAGWWAPCTRCAGADRRPPGVGQRRMQPQRGSHGAGEARGGLHGG